MKLHYVFSEMPYAMALFQNQLKSRCSFCAGAASVICSNLCNMTAYCDESCMINDRPFHEPECIAYRQGKKLSKNGTIDISVRLVGRILARYETDKGVVNLSTDFPSHFVKDRCFDDLMSHTRELRRDRGREKTFRETRKFFRDFFESTSLASTSDSMLRRFNDQATINGFVLITRLNSNPDSRRRLGESVYLNASRFNHECRPSCLYRFDGARIVISYVDYDDAHDGPIQFSPEQFQNLTLTYGFGLQANYGCSCSLTEQRLRSLKSRYYFKCRCDLCKNETRTKIESDAAAVECDQCKLPYVWNREWFTVNLKKLCKCRSDASTSENARLAMQFGKDAPKQVKKLIKKWPVTMAMIKDAECPREVIKSTAPVVELARKFWHPRYNLRLGQLNQMLYMAMENVVESSGASCVSDDLDFLLQCGEGALNVYLIYCQPYMVTVAGLALNVARMYAARGRAGDLERAERWFRFSMSMYADRGETECAEAIEAEMGKAIGEPSEEVSMPTSPDPENECDDENA